MLNKTESKCEVNGVKQSNISITFENGVLNFSGVTKKGTKCYVYFDNKINLIVQGSNYNGTYDKKNHNIIVNVSNASDYKVYYATDKVLTEDNYLEGSTTAPSRANAGTTVVSWCATASGYTVECGSNNISIEKATPTFKVSNASFDVKEVSSYTATYEYDGDGVLSCDPINGNYAKCSINSENKTITFTMKNYGTEVFTIKATNGINYLDTQKTISVKFSSDWNTGTSS